MKIMDATFLIIVFGMCLFFGIMFTYAIITASYEKEMISKMDCQELRDYIIEKEITVEGFKDIAKSLHKYKCEI